MSQALDRVQHEIPTFDEMWSVSVTRYHQMIRDGVLGPDDKIELLEGRLVQTMSKNPIHEAVAGIVDDALRTLLPSQYFSRAGGPVTTDDSEPEPDLSIVRGKRQNFFERHPTPRETALVVEVANSSLARDRGLKLRIYATAGVPVYWIVNTIDQCVEVLSSPSSTERARYATRVVFTRGQRVPVELDGTRVGEIAVDDLFPPKP